MHITIYFDDKPLFLCDKVDARIEPFVHHDDAIFIDEFNSHTVKTMIHEMQQQKVHAGVFLHSSLEELQQAVFRKFTRVEAAGGLVSNGAGEFLLIFRRGKWDLPKGKLDKGETLADCALREVEEETGLTKIEMAGPLLTTYHTYHEGSKYVLKSSHWFRMKVDGSPATVPQTEEDIREVRWVAPADIAGYKKEAFASVKDVLEAGLPK